jgi:hypothetical protein
VAGQADGFAGRGLDDVPDDAVAVAGQALEQLEMPEPLIADLVHEGPRGRGPVEIHHEGHI